MSRQIFLISGSVQPSRRWLSAFPQGQGLGVEAAIAAADRDTVLWVATAMHDWCAVLGRLVDSLPGVPIGVVSLAPDDSEGLRALENGASAYCHALAAPELFQEVAVAVCHGGLWIGPELMRRVLGAARKGLSVSEDVSLSSILSPREVEVARAAANGASNREIAEILNISERTVKAHMKAIFEKLGVRDRLQLILRMTRQGELVQVR